MRGVERGGGRRLEGEDIGVVEVGMVGVMRGEEEEEEEEDEPVTLIGRSFGATAAMVG